MCYSGTEEQREAASATTIPLINARSLLTSSNNKAYPSSAPPKSMTFGDYARQGALGCVMGLATTLFSLYFPFVLTPTAANAVYDPAPGFHYVEGLSFFDNSAWTYATDYALAVVLSLLCWHIYTHPNILPSYLRKWTIGLLLGCYATSVLAGGLAHQFYTSLEMRNSWSFRLLWCVCVGTVYFASACMGSAASEVARYFIRDSRFTTGSFLWVMFGLTTTSLYVAGYLSYQRPACDIFIAGITQFPPTAYMMLICLLARKNDAYQVKGPLVFIGNAPLLPLYALLVYYTDMSLSQINTLLHMWLCVCWSGQGWTLRHYMLQSMPLPPQAQEQMMWMAKKE